jgi:hypothetical protein
MICTSCRSCGADLSAVPGKGQLFTQFLMKVVRCPHCRLRTTVLTLRRKSDGLKKMRFWQHFSAL